MKRLDQFVRAFRHDYELQKTHLMHKAARPVCSCEEVPLPAGWERHRFCLDERNYRRGTIASLKRSQSTITPMHPKRAQQPSVFSPYADVPLDDVINFTDYRINSR